MRAEWAKGGVCRARATQRRACRTTALLVVCIETLGAFVDIDSSPSVVERPVTKLLIPNIPALHP